MFFFFLLTGDAGGAVNKDENHATKSPGDSEKANAATRIALVFVANDGGDGDVEEEKGGHEFCNYGSVKRPQFQLRHVNHGCRRRIHVVFPRRFSDFAHFFRHFLFLSLKVGCFSL